MMRASILAYRKNIFSILKLPCNQGRKYSSEPHRCDAHMNELPVPCGAWEPWYNEKQSTYTKILIFGALWWAFSLGVFLYTESLDLNFSAPSQPGPPSDMVEECEDVE